MASVDKVGGGDGGSGGGGGGGGGPVLPPPAGPRRPDEVGEDYGGTVPLVTVGVARSLRRGRRGQSDDAGDGTADSAAAATAAAAAGSAAAAVGAAAVGTGSAAGSAGSNADGRANTSSSAGQAGPNVQQGEQPQKKKKKGAVLFGRLPLLPLRLIHDFLPGGAGSSAGGSGGGEEARADAADSGGARRVLFLLSRRLAFNVREAVEWKDLFTAETVRATLSAKECRRLLSNIHKAQLLIRTELKINEWGTRDYARCHTGINYACAFEDRTPRIHAASEDDFIRQHEALGGVPVVVTGLTDDWPARKHWKLSRLLRRFGGMKWRVGDDDDGYPVNMRLAAYFWYTQHVAPYEDNPLYLFDSSFEDSKVRSKVLSDYKVPDLFSDQFAGIREAVRPPYRWLLIGPPRSGSGIHHDPLATSAWNTCVFGHKRWILFHPSTPRAIVRPDAIDPLWPGHIGGAIAWFEHVYPLTRDRSTWADGNPLYQPVEILQGPGETVCVFSFIPTGWWHVVVNLDYTVAVTQNFAEKRNFARVRRKVKKRRKDIFRSWLRTIDEPDSPDEQKDEFDSGWDSSSASTSSSSSSTSSGDVSSDSDSSESSNAVRSLVGAGEDSSDADEEKEE